MRKRLFIFAAATCFALSTFATPAFAEDTNLEDGQIISSEASVQSNGNSNGNSDFATPAFAEEPSLPDGQTISSEARGGSEDALHNGSDDGSTDGSSTVGGEQEKDNGNATPGASHDPVAGGSAGSAMTLAGTIAVQNVQDWINSNPASPSGSATFTLEDDFTTDQGLLFKGDPADPADSRKTFIIDAQNHNITLNDYGIGATYCNVIIQNCNTLTIKAHRHPVQGVFDSACYFGHATLKLSNCTNVTIENDEKDQRASGISVYDEGSLYFDNKTNVAISGYMAEGCSGIYMDRDDAGYDKIMGQIVVSNNSTLTATKCYHNGITANPIDIIVSDNSELNVNNNNNPNDNDGEGGLGCYYGTLTIENNSRVISENNHGAFSVYLHNIDVDGTSEIQSLNNALYGVTFDGDTILRSTADGTSGAKMIADGNYGPGIAPVGKEGTLAVEKGATLSSCHNINRGMANESKTFTVASGAHVYFKENYFEGLDNYPYTTTIVEADADFVVTGNGSSGIKNGNVDYGYGTLELHSGTITDNNIKGASFTFRNKTVTVNEGYRAKYGGGIYNDYGSISVDSTVNICNNDAVTAGADLYNCNNDGNSFTITVVPGANGNVLKEDGKYIDYWYKDESLKRWREDDAIRYTESIVSPGGALKAAHDINADIYVPEPEQPNEPKPSPDPEPKPDPKPEPKPNPAPAEPSASPEPDVTPTPTPAAAPSAIPQTGDTLPLVPLGLAALGSITALCVLQKRRKSKS